MLKKHEGHGYFFIVDNVLYESYSSTRGIGFRTVKPVPGEKDVNRMGRDEIKRIGAIFPFTNHQHTILDEAERQCKKEKQNLAYMTNLMSEKAEIPPEKVSEWLTAKRKDRRK